MAAQDSQDQQGIGGMGGVVPPDSAPPAPPQPPVPAPSLGDDLASTSSESVPEEVDVTPAVESGTAAPAATGPDMSVSEGSATSGAVSAETVAGAETVASPPPSEGEVPPTPTTPSASSVSSGGKRRFPKKIVFLIVFVFLLFAGAVFVYLNLGNLRERFGAPEEVSVTWWGLWEDEAIVEPLISEYQSQNPNVTINYVKQSKTDYRERLNAAIARGEGPDIFRFHNTWTPMFARSLDPLPSEVMTATDFSKTFYPVAASDLAIGTNLVGIPLEIDGLALFVNEEIFESYARSVPETWDEFTLTAIDLTIKDEDDLIIQSGAAMGLTENVDHWQEILSLLMLQNGVRMTEPVGERAEEALNYYVQFSKDLDLWDRTLPPSTVAFANGKLAMYFGPSWRVFEIEELNPDLRYKIYPVPQVPKDNPGQADVSLASYWVEGVWSESEVKNEAWKFLAYLSTNESLQKLYQNSAQIRLFGEPYSRVGMSDLLVSDPKVGAFVQQGPEYRSWYLVSRTFDGSTGINSQMSKYYEDAVNGANDRFGAAGVLTTLARGVNQVLATYGLVTPLPTGE